MCVTISGVFLVIRARYAEEKKRKLLEHSQSTTTLEDDVTSASLLQKEVELGVMDGEKEGGRVGVTFSVNEITNDWLSTSDEEIEEGGKKKKKGAYASVSSDGGELREVLASA